MLKLRFMSNPTIATASLDLSKDYADYLCGEHVWALAVKGADGPIACPCVRQVRNYDQPICESAHKFVKAGKDIKTALESAMADADTRMLNSRPRSAWRRTRTSAEFSRPLPCRRSTPVSRAQRGGTSALWS